MPPAPARATLELRGAAVDDRQATLHPGVTTVPVTGMEPCRVVAVTRAGDRGRLTAAFRAAAPTWAAARAAD
ncbi:hypothetical protein Asp14428_21890 [Actinoplanes sp. NBRC 14428]|nr:hypothetical protein Asp14428_21890 [Actinoplanes sp. NBRC 14428]